MKVLEVGTLNIKKGGPPFSLSRQMMGANMNDIETICFMQPCDVSDIIEKNLEYRFSKPVSLKLLGMEFFPGINESLDELSNCDLMHIQDTWTYLSHGSAKYALKHHIPYIIAPRGNLYKRAMSNKWIKKQLAWYAYVRKDLENATCVQATCIEEMDQLRELGCNRPIAVIPNSYDIDTIKHTDYCKDEVFRVGYIGRLHPRKNVDMLLYSLSQLYSEGANIELHIIGEGEFEYEKHLKRLAERLGIENAVRFLGFLKGCEKDEAIRQCHVFCFPSDFENFGNVVPDVLIRGVPVIATKGMPWKSVEESNSGWWIDNNQDEINKTIQIAYSMNRYELELMGENGRKLIKENFSVEKIGLKLKELYLWILNGGAKPDFVYI